MTHDVTSAFMRYLHDLAYGEYTEFHESRRAYLEARRNDAQETRVRRNVPP